MSQYWQNGNTEVKEKLLTWNCNILQTAERQKSKFYAFSDILVNKEKLDLNAFLSQIDLQITLNNFKLLSLEEVFQF